MLSSITPFLCVSHQLGDRARSQASFQFQGLECKLVGFLVFIDGFICFFNLKIICIYVHVSVQLSIMCIYIQGGLRAPGSSVARVRPFEPTNVTAWNRIWILWKSSKFFKPLSYLFVPSFVYYFRR